VDLPCQTVKGLIQEAYNLSQAKGRMPLLAPIEGGPGWMNSERYTISATAEGNPGLEVMRGPMLQALLEERFNLKLRRETREVPVYFLTVAKGGAKLRTADPGNCVALDPKLTGPPPAKGFCGSAKNVRSEGNLTVQFRSVDFGIFAKNLGVNAGPQLLDRPVIDKTGITGTYDIDLQFAPEGVVDATGPSIFTAVEEQLGLKLEAGRGPVEVLVVESVERPTEN
jgi:uncharacterized protein (TIGR03435 family)